MTSTKKYRIRPTTDEQKELKTLVSRGRIAVYKQTHARILVMNDESRPDGWDDRRRHIPVHLVWDCQWSRGCVDRVWRKASSRPLTPKAIAAPAEETGRWG